jgi:Spy/CpxP family protein refolding chaperone
MNRFRSLTLAALLAGVVAAGAAYAQGPDGRGPGARGPGGFGRGGGLPLRALNLTDAQQQQVRTLTQQYREQNRAAEQRLRAAFTAQRQAVETVPVNEALIRSTTQDLAEAQTEVALQRARMHADVFALLTPEQQAEARKLQTERQARGQQRQGQRQRQNQQQN